MTSSLLPFHIKFNRAARALIIFHWKISSQLLAEHFDQHQAEAFRFADIEPVRKTQAVVLHSERNMVIDFGDGNLYWPGFSFNKSIFHGIGKQFIDDDPQGKQLFWIKIKISDLLFNDDLGLVRKYRDNCIDQIIKLIFLCLIKRRFYYRNLSLLSSF